MSEEVKAWVLWWLFVIFLIGILFAVGEKPEDEPEKAGFKVWASEIEEETVIAPLDENMAEIRSGMPCDDWRVRYEQETNEEGSDEALRGGFEDCPEGDALASEEDLHNAKMENQSESPVPIYQIAGEVIDPDIQVRLYSCLNAVGLEDWYTGALCQMFQESRGNPNAVNGVDKGIFQYRETSPDGTRKYWEPTAAQYGVYADIFDPDAQMTVYARQMAARFSAGLSVDEAISRHYTSDYVTTVAWDYVAQVKQWFSKMEVIK